MSTLSIDFSGIMLILRFFKNILMTIKRVSRLFLKDKSEASQIESTLLSAKV